MPMGQFATRWAHADAGGEGPGRLRAELARTRCAARRSGPRLRWPDTAREWRHVAYKARILCRPLHPGEDVLSEPDRAGEEPYHRRAGLRVEQGRGADRP